VREKPDGSYVVSLSHRGGVWHYSIDVRVTDYGDKLRIENGPSFDNLMDVRMLTYSQYPRTLGCACEIVSRFLLYHQFIKSPYLFTS